MRGMQLVSCRRGQRDLPVFFTSCLPPHRLSARRVVRAAAEEKKEADVQATQEPAAQGGTFYNDERPVSGQDLVWGWRGALPAPSAPLP